MGWVGDPAGKQQMAELRRQGLSVGPANNDVMAGIDTVYSLFQAGRLKVFRTLTGARDELAGYVWKRTAGGFGDQPVKERDDLMDALRYALHTRETRAGLALHV